MDIPSLKKMLVVAIATAVSKDGPFCGNKVLLLTASGMIEGLPIWSSGETAEIEYPTTTGDPAIVGSLLDQIATDYKNEYGLEKLSGNDGFLLLKDAVLRDTTLNTKCNFPYLAVFYDQIIGISHGNISK